METNAIILTQSHDLYTLCPENDHTTLLTGRVSGKMMHAASSPADYPTVGDRVLTDWDGRSARAVICSILPRKSTLARVGDPATGERQLIAANLDTLILCMSMNQNYSLSRAERYIAAAMAGGVTPVIVLTKADVCAEPETLLAQTCARFPNTQVLMNCMPDMPAVQAIRAMLERGQCMAFAGSSGVGKSTLINAVLGAEVMRTSAIRESDGRGRHTTTHREMIFPTMGGAVIDTPGMRAFALDDADVDSAFVDLAELATRCRFSDCTHQSEPGCAIRQALADGLVDARSVNSYIRLHREVDRRAAFIKNRYRHR